MYKTVILVSIAIIALAIGILMVRKVKFSDQAIPLFNKIKFSWLYILTFVIISFFRIYWDTQKTGFFLDEYLQISICNRNDEGMSLWPGCMIGELDTLRPYSGQEILEKAFFDDDSFSDTVDDIKHLWINTKDPSHTALSYMLTRILFTGVKTHDLDTIIHRECALNYLFFILTFFIILRAFSTLIDNKLIISLLLCISFINPASIFLGTLMRSYGMQETAIAAMGYLIIRYFQLFNKGIFNYPKSLYIKTLIIITFVISTDYFPVFFVGLCIIAITIRLMIKKQKQEILYFLSICMFAYCIANLLYPGYGLMLFSGQGVNQLKAFSDINNISTNIYMGLINVVWNINFKFMDIFFLIAVLSANIYLLYKSKKTTEIKGMIMENIPMLLFIITIIWITFVMLTAPYKDLRYIAPIFVLLSMAFVPMSELYKKHLPLTVTIMIMCCCATGERCVPWHVNRANIPWIDGDFRCNISFFKNPTIPVIVTNNCINYNWMPYVNENQTYYIINEGSNPDVLKQKKYYLLTPKNIDQIEEQLIDSSIQ